MGVASIMDVPTLADRRHHSYTSFHRLRASNMNSAGTRQWPEWFVEDPHEKLVVGQSFSLKVKKILYQGRSKYQDILVFESETHGNVLALDDIIQCTEKDEFAYQEMMAHVPLYCHSCPRAVLVVGGGDGGILREIIKHPMVEEAHLCEIDEEVISVSKTYLKNMARGFDHSKVKVFVQDGVEFVREANNRYDVIITDCSDPQGPAEVLYQPNYFKLIHKALRPGGIMCLQGQCIWLPQDKVEVLKVLQICREVFAVTDYASFSVPSYPTGNIGAILTAKDTNTNFKDPVRMVSQEEVDRLELKYYDHDIHRAAFVLPRCFRKELNLHQCDDVNGTKYQD